MELLLQFHIKNLRDRYKKIKSFGKANSIVFDIKNVFNSKSIDLKL